MLKLELDWVTEVAPLPLGNDEDHGVRVELLAERGLGGGWPTIAVFVPELEGRPQYESYMRLVGWLRDVYGLDEDEAEEYQDMATVV